MSLDLVLAGPLQDRPARKISATDYASRFPMQANQRIQLARHPSPREAGVRGQAQVLLAAIIVDRENPEPARRAKRIGDKVHRPAVTSAKCPLHRCPTASGAPSLWADSISE